MKLNLISLSLLLKDVFLGFFGGTYGMGTHKYWGECFTTLSFVYRLRKVS